MAHCLGMAKTFSVMVQVQVECVLMNSGEQVNNVEFAKIGFIP